MGAGPYGGRGADARRVQRGRRRDGGVRGPPTAEEVAAIFAGDFSAEAAVTVGISEETDDSLDLTALVTKSDGSCLVEVTAPEHLEGLTFSVDSLEAGDLTVQYKGLEIQPDSMPGSNLGGVLAGALETLSSPEQLTLSETESGWCVTGETEAGGFAVLIDGETHYPLSLTLPDAKVGCSFTSFEAMSVFRPDRVDEDMQPELEPSEAVSEPSGTESSESSAASGSPESTVPEELSASSAEGD